ncbi:hypothetical protein J1N35_041627 [Gossypium stocksii]|uniref:ubiquitinyl hydrolase 1 n=1 Tax=Gossypium stocksii TaxID=47602 RepID=A0A9D3ZJW2_9ROSI|nr:hypothetical protein J1N35_041627 [Gossypium stocksii]
MHGKCVGLLSTPTASKKYTWLLENRAFAHEIGLIIKVTNELRVCVYYFENLIDWFVGNGGILYHEVQESKLSAVHCVNTVLQGPFFSEFDLAALASYLDTKERQMMFQGTPPPPVAISSLRIPTMSPRRRFPDCIHYVDVLQKALEVWHYQNNPLNCPLAEPAQIDPELENAFICHLHDHWFCIRKVNGEWYNFNSLYTAPEHFSKFYLSAYPDSLKGAGWSVFLVRGNFPKEFHISSTEAFNGYGQWLSPEDAERITKSSNLIQAPPQRNNTQQHPDPLDETDTHMLLDMEDEDLKAAIATSLMDSSPAAAMTEASNPKSKNKDSPEKTAKAENFLTYWASDNGSCHVLDGLSKHIRLEVVCFVMTKVKSTVENKEHEISSK